MNLDTAVRQPHAVLDLQSRNLKAMKIERLLELGSRPQPIRILEIGTGSGGIAHYFATHPTLRCEVEAADVFDNRTATKGYHFTLVQGTRLPFNKASFDVVLTNHVIEHVGDSGAQYQHLLEIHRVLKPNGIGYLAVPNRWMLIEPHYHLAFLSWLPHAWRTNYLRIMRKGSFYDVEPLQLRQLEHMFAATGFCFKNICIPAWRATLDIERPYALSTRVLRATPDFFLKPLRRIIPTLIYRIEHSSA